MSCRQQLFVLTVVFAACAAPKATMSAQEAFAPARQAPTPLAAPTPRDLKRWAAAFQRPAECNRGARELEAERGHELGWQALEACVGRGDFSLLPELLTWGADLRSHAEGPGLIAQVVAAYGGSNLAEAIPAARARGLPLVDLSAVLDAPRASVGKTVLMLGRPGERSKQGLLLAEVSLGGMGPAPVPGLPTNNRVAPTINADGTKSFGKEWTPAGDGYMKRTATAEESKQYERETQANKLAVDARKAPQGPAWTGNTLTETGVEVKAKAPAGLPLVEGRDYVLLVRVDGSVKEPPPEGEEQPTLRILTTVLGAWALDVKRSEFLGR